MVITETKPPTATLLLPMWAQFVALCVVFGTILMHMGKRDFEVEATSKRVTEIQDIISELTKAQINTNIRSSLNGDSLINLQGRIERLERFSK